eukprot:6477895-Amphidinium_carterae.2
MKSFCKFALSIVDDVDPLDLSEKSAACLAQTRTVLNTLVALLEDDFHIEFEFVHATIAAMFFKHETPLIVGLPEADVMRVKGKLYATDTSLVTKVAVAMKEQEFYMSSMNRYAQDLVNYKEHGAAFAETFQQLQTMDGPTIEHVDALSAMLKNWPKWRDALRKLTCEKFQHKLLQTIKNFAANMDVSDKTMMTSMSSVIAEACILFPMDPELPETQQALGTKAAEAYQQEGWKTLRSNLHSVSELEPLPLREAMESF